MPVYGQGDQDKDYVKLERKRLVRHRRNSALRFPCEALRFVFDYDYTASLERDLDQVAARTDRLTVVQTFWKRSFQSHWQALAAEVSANSPRQENKPEAPKNSRQMARNVAAISWNVIAPKGHSRGVSTTRNVKELRNLSISAARKEKANHEQLSGFAD